MPPIFEESTSPLANSNDGRLVVRRLWSSADVWAVVDRQAAHSDSVVLETKTRTLADAYIAGYDLATEKEHQDSPGGGKQDDPKTRDYRSYLLMPYDLLP